MKNQSDVYQGIKDLVAAASVKYCSVDGCEKPRKFRHFCKQHYNSFRNRGGSFESEPHLKISQAHNFLIDLVENEHGPECIIWPFTKTCGYGVFSYKHTLHRIHRIVCLEVNGPPPSAIHEAAHGCGVSLCCNPRHLSWKTHKENISDKEKHGTVLLGEKHHRSKLTESQVREIWGLRNKASRRELSSRFNVSVATITDINVQKTWRHVTSND